MTLEVVMVKVKRFYYKFKISLRIILALTIIGMQLMIVIGASVSFLLGSVLSWRKLALAGKLL